MNRKGAAGRARSGVTLVEVLIAMSVLVVVFMITSSGIISALRTQRVQEDATNSQAKMRRVVEVLTQELRGAVLGGITDYPLETGENAISFALLAGDGGVLAENPPGASWGTSEVTNVFASDEGAIDALVGGPAVMVNKAGDALIIPEVTLDPSGTKVQHVGCKISIPYTPGTRLIGVRALGFRYDAESSTLYQVEVGGGGESNSTVPFAFELEEFSLGYEYESSDGAETRSEPWRTAGGEPLSVYFDGLGERHDLTRLRLSVATRPYSGRGERDYVSFVEMTGTGDAERIERLQLCDGTTLPPVDEGDGGSGGDGGDGGGDGGSGGDGGDGSGGDDGPGGKW